MNFFKAPDIEIFSVLGCVPLFYAVINVREDKAVLGFCGSVTEHLSSEARWSRGFIFPHSLEGGSEFAWSYSVHCVFEIWVDLLCFNVAEYGPESGRHFGPCGE